MSSQGNLCSSGCFGVFFLAPSFVNSSKCCVWKSQKISSHPGQPRTRSLRWHPPPPPQPPPPILMFGVCFFFLHFDAWCFNWSSWPVFTCCHMIGWLANCMIGTNEKHFNQANLFLGLFFYASFHRVPFVFILPVLTADLKISTRALRWMKIKEKCLKKKQKKTNLSLHHTTPNTYRWHE